MKALWMGMALGLGGVASAQDVFTNGIAVHGQGVRGVGLIDLTNTNLSWGSMVPSLAQLAGLDPANGANLGSAFLVPLRPAWLEIDGIYARTSNGLTFYDENGSAVLRIRAGALWSAGGAISNLTLNAKALAGGRWAAAVLPSGGAWDAGGMTLSNVTVSGNGAGLRGISAQHIVGLGSAAQRSASTFAMAEQGSLAETALQPDSYAPDLGASITTNFVTDTNTLIVTGTGFPATLTYGNESDGQYYYLAGSPDLLVNIAWTNKPLSVRGDYWAQINGTWYLAYTCSGSPTAPTGTLTAVNTVYLWGSRTAADAAFSWDNTSSVWTNMAAYWIATNTTTQTNEMWGPSGTTNVLLATSSALNGDWTVQSYTPTLIWSDGIWGTITMSVDNSGNANYVYNAANAVKITSDGNVHYLAQWNANAPQADMIFGQTDSNTLVGTVYLHDGLLVQGTENDGFYAWNSTNSQYELNGYSIIVDINDYYNLCDPTNSLLYHADFETANTTAAWTTDNGTGECHSGITPGQACGTTAYGNLGPSIPAPSSFYPNPTNGVSQYADVIFQTNKLSYVSGLAINALQPGVNLTNLTGQLLVTALPTGIDKTWNAGGLTLSNMTVSGNGMGLTNVPGSAIVGLSASQITSGLLNPALFSTNGFWDIGGLVLTNVAFAAGTISTPTLAQVLAAGNDGGGQALTNVVLRGAITVETGHVTNLTVYGSTTLHYVPAQGDVAMGSYTNQP